MRMQSIVFKTIITVSPQSCRQSRFWHVAWGFTFILMLKESLYEEMAGSYLNVTFFHQHHNVRS